MRGALAWRGRPVSRPEQRPLVFPLSLKSVGDSYYSLPSMHLLHVIQMPPGAVVPTVWHPVAMRNSLPSTSRLVERGRVAGAVVAPRLMSSSHAKRAVTRSLMHGRAMLSKSPRL